MIPLSELFSAAALAALVVSAPDSSAQQSQEPLAAEQTATEDAGELFQQFERHLLALEFDSALSVAEQFDPPSREAEGIVAAMRAAALLGLKREEEARTLIAESEKLAPQEPLPGLLIFSAGLLTDRYDVAADALDRMIARFPDVVREIPAEQIGFLLSNEPEEQKVRNEDRRVALARLGFGGDDGDYLTAEAVGILIKRGDTTGAEDLLRYIDAPTVVEDLLIQRRYAALWPKIEEMAGPHLQNVRQSSVAAAQRAFAANGDDPEKLQILANALRHAGRVDEAIALRSKLPPTREAMGAIDQQTGWAVNNIALALHEAGRGAEADELFAMLNQAEIEDGSWRVSMIINRLELLVADGKFEEALPLLDGAEVSARDHGNDYARQLVRRLKYCTMSGLGRREEAARLLPKVLEHSGDAIAATIDGLICAGELEEAEKLILASLQDEAFQEAFVRNLQRNPLTSDDPSFWSKGWRGLRQRPAIMKAFERLGRDMPDNLLPRPGD